MPIPPAPFTLECPNCHWHVTYAPPSDVLPPQPTTCPRCEARLHSRRASVFDAALATLARKLNHRR